MQLIGLMDGMHWSAGWLAGEAVSRNAAAGFVTSLWQGAAIAIALWLGLRMAPQITAAQRFVVWGAGFSAALGLTVLSMISGLQPGGGEGGVGSGVESVAHGGPWLALDARWGVAIACLWAAASLYRAVDLAVHSVKLRRLWKGAKPVALDREIAEASSRRVEICTTEALERPSVIGFFAPRILIPDWLFARLTRGELEQIALHESEHLRRADDWTNLLQKLCLIAFPLNPALWWMERRLCGEREMACDEGVVRITNAPRAYASCLASIAERGLERRMGTRAEALSLGAWERRSELVGRVHGILKRKHALSPMAAGVMLGAMGCGLAAGSVALTRCPQLVTFVPAQKLESAQALAAAKTDGKLEALRGSLPSGYYAMSAKATLPEPKSAHHVESMHGKKATTSSGPQKSSRDFLEQTAEATAGRNTAKDEKAQGWIVLTTWEQVQVRRSGTDSDYKAKQQGLGEAVVAGAASAAAGNAGQNGGKTDGNNGKTDAQGASQYRVTQLILRILPAGSNSNERGATTERSGWFVIQL